MRLKILFAILFILSLILNAYLLIEFKRLKNELNWCCIGTWIDYKTGQGYSGPRKNILDIPANPKTGERCY